MDIIIGKQGNQPFKLTESSISRQHALFHLDETTGKMFLRDSNSTNGTWVLARDGEKALSDKVEPYVNCLRKVMRELMANYLN